MSTGVALFVWLVFVFISDLGLMAGTVLFRLRVQEIFGLAVLNPLQSFKMAVVVSMNASLDVLGPVGVYASHTLGAALPWILVGMVVLWVMIPLILATLLFVRRNSS